MVREKCNPVNIRATKALIGGLLKAYTWLKCCIDLIIYVEVYEKGYVGFRLKFNISYFYFEG